MKARAWPLLAGLAIAVLLAITVLADRALRAHAEAAAEGQAKMAAFAVRQALGEMERALLAGKGPSPAHVERLTIPGEAGASPDGSVPYLDRSREELLSLTSSRGASASGLPEAIVALIALKIRGEATAEARHSVIERLLSGELPIQPSDVAPLAAKLGIAGDERLARFERRLATAPRTAEVPEAPAFARSLAASRTVEAWTRQGDLCVVLTVRVDDLLDRAGVRRVAWLPGDASLPERGRGRHVSVPDVDGMVLGVAPEEPLAARANIQRAVLWTAAVVGTLGLLAMIAGVRRESRAVAREKAFLASVTHELRTPLAALRVFGETLLAGRGEPREYGGLIAEESQRLESLIERVLAVTRIDARPDFAAVDPRDIAQQAVTLIAARAARRGVTLEVDLPVGLPQARWDPDAVRAALANLLDNAVRHGRSGGHVALRASCSDGHIALAVQDDGPGISRRDRKGLFGRFERRRQGGTGLGLYLVDQAARAHGGRVDLATEEGHGSTFTLVLPVEPEPRP